MISGKSGDKSFHITGGEYFLGTLETPFNCLLEGTVSQFVEGVDTVTIYGEKEEKNFNIVKAERLGTGRMYLRGDSWHDKNIASEVINMKKGENFRDAFPKMEIHHKGDRVKLAHNLLNISPMTIKEKALYISRNLRVLANYYGKRILVFAGEGNSEFNPRENKLKLGVKSKYKPGGNTNYFFDKPEYEAIKIYGTSSKDISLFDISKYGVALSVRKFYKNLNEFWEATFVKL